MNQDAKGGGQHQDQCRGPGIKTLFHFKTAKLAHVQEIDPVSKLGSPKPGNDMLSINNSYHYMAPETSSSNPRQVTHLIPASL